MFALELQEMVHAIQRKSDPNYSSLNLRLEEYFFKQMLPPSKHTTLLQPALLKYFLSHKHTNSQPLQNNTKLLQTHSFFHPQLPTEIQAQKE